ncbi:N-acetylglucosamine-6-phosphate deacetylase [Exiguobacterium undae]|uniref:N-acetylglucosamine-6-phosphate deacetylase n=1 Tax=Exiguobacterium undae TaxID=169177 RepID=A0ABX2V4Y1_9BACL|nr:N-acetylglucosamine-6-phosphate deacetylase [Exiguobacterium undae]OAN10123.1 N-acetylglucosamine-6-phosphate deacetylase [Exiguobacterium undae]
MSNIKFNSPSLLEVDATMHLAKIQFENGNWKRYEILGEGQYKKSGSYLVPSLPVEFHCHGIGDYDFSNLDELDLERVNVLAEEEGIYCVPSIFLPHHQLDLFILMMNDFAVKKSNGKLSNILGISLEGPLLASFAGTPAKGNWAPTKEEWSMIASCGNLGLIYTVLSPDTMTKDSYLKEQITDDHPSIEWIVKTLVENGIKPALGHFQKNDPIHTSELIKQVIKIAKDTNRFMDSTPVITDHLFNDMPLNFKHTWRTSEERKVRLQELYESEIQGWSLDNICEKVGQVPGTLIKAAAAGDITICMNFDSEHVDLEIVRKVVELIGTSNIIAMTDRIDTDVMCGQELKKNGENNLWYQGKGYVAAGSYTIDRLMHNIRSIGFNESDIWNLTSFTPLREAHHLNQLKSQEIVPFSFVDETKTRTHLTTTNPDLLFI